MAYILVKSFEYANQNEQGGYFQRCESRYGREFLFHEAFPMTNAADNAEANAFDNARLVEFFDRYSDAALVARLDHLPEVTRVMNPEWDDIWALETDPRLAQA